MTREMFLMGIGALFILIGIAGSIRLKDGEVFIKNNWARAVLFVIGITLLILGVFPPSPHSAAVENTPRECNNCITIPPNRGEVGNSIIVKGNYRDLHDDLWVIIWPELGGNTGWPQSNDALHGTPAYKSGGKWSVSCSFGGPPQSYEIALYSAPQSASAALSTALREWAAANDFPGIKINNLPDGLVELDRITVIKSH